MITQCRKFYSSMKIRNCKWSNTNAIVLFVAIAPAGNCDEK